MYVAKSQIPYIQSSVTTFDGLKFQSLIIFQCWAWLRLNVYVRPHAVVCPKIGQASADVMSPNPSMQTTELWQEPQQRCNYHTKVAIVLHTQQISSATNVIELQGQQKIRQKKIILNALYLKKQVVSLHNIYQGPTHQDLKTSEAAIKIKIRIFLCWFLNLNVCVVFDSIIILYIYIPIHPLSSIRIA